MKRTVEFEHTLTLIDTETECVEVEVKVTANFYPGSPPVFYYANGDGDPGCDDEIEVTKIVRKDNGVGMDWDSLPSACKEALNEAVTDAVSGDGDDDPPERDHEEDHDERERCFADAAND